MFLAPPLPDRFCNRSRWSLWDHAELLQKGAIFSTVHFGPLLRRKTMQNHLKKLVPLALLLALPGCAAHVGAGGAIGPAGHVAGGPQGHGPGMGGRPPHVRAPRGGPGGANHAAARAAVTPKAGE